MDYQDQIQNYLNIQSQLNANVLQMQDIADQKAEAEKEEGGEDVGLSAMLGEFGTSSFEELLKNSGLSEESINDFKDMLTSGLKDGTVNINDLKDILPEDTLGSLKGILSKGVSDVLPDASKLISKITPALSDVKALGSDIVPKLAEAVPKGLADVVPKGLADVVPKGLADVVPKLAEAVPKLGDAIPKGLADVVPKGLADVVPKLAPDVAKLAPKVADVIPKSSSGLKSINASDIKNASFREKDLFFRDAEVQPSIRSRALSVFSPKTKVKETNIDDLLFRKDLGASDENPLSIAGAPEDMKLFSGEGEFLGSTLSRLFNQEKLMKSLPDIPMTDLKPPPPPPLEEAPGLASDVAPKVASEAPGLASDIAPKLGDAIPKLAGSPLGRIRPEGDYDIVPKVAENVGASVGEKLATTEGLEGVAGALDATGIGSPIGTIVGIGAALYSGITGLEDLFKTRAPTYTPPPIASLFQAT
jgi:hypothetical protein